MTQPLILLDLDSVVVDFMGAVSKLGYANVGDSWPDVFDPAQYYGFASNNEMWKAIDSCGIEFWSGMETYPWARKLYDELCKIAPVTFCTTPAANPLCAAGKMEWMQKFTGSKFFREFMLTPRKHQAARHDRFLVDDNIRLCKEYAEAGGPCFLWPTTWNNVEGWSADGSTQLEKCLEAVREWASTFK